MASDLMSAYPVFRQWMEIGDRIDKIGDKPVKNIPNADLEMMLKTCPAEVLSQID